MRSLVASSGVRVGLEGFRAFLGFWDVVLGSQASGVQG